MGNYVLTKGEGPYKNAGADFHRCEINVLEEGFHAARIVVFGTEESCVELRQALIGAMDPQPALPTVEMALDQWIRVAANMPDELVRALDDRREASGKRRAELEGLIRAQEREFIRLTNLRTLAKNLQEVPDEEG